MIRASDLTELVLRVLREHQTVSRGLARALREEIESFVQRGMASLGAAGGRRRWDGLSAKEKAAMIQKMVEGKRRKEDGSR